MASQSRSLAAAIVCVAVVVARVASPDQQSVWSGVYTDAQADQGAAVYKTHCVSCHGDTMAGGEQVPALARRDVRRDVGRRPALRSVRAHA